MQSSLKGLVIFGDHKVFLYDTFDQVPLSAWTHCNSNDDLFLSSSYLSACEKAQLPGLSVKYVLIHENNQPVAALYFQSANLSDAGLGGVLNLEDYGMIAGAITSRINAFLFEPGSGRSSHLLVCGNLLVSGDHGIAAVSREAFDIALGLLESLFKHLTSGFPPGKKVVAWMVKDFSPERDNMASEKLSASFFRLNTDPVMNLKISADWKTFDDYLDALSSKYRVRANASIARQNEIVIRDLEADEMLKRESEIGFLLEQVISKAPVKLVRPTTGYFLELKAHFKNHYDFRGMFLEDKMVAFTSGLWDAGHYEAHYIGLDYSTNKEYSLYQNILYGYIEDAIRRHSAVLFYGRTALEIKSTVGARPLNMGCYLRLNNRIFHALAKPLIGATGPGSWIPRDPFRKDPA